MIATFVLAAALSAASQSAPPARQPDTSQTLSVAKGARLTIDNYAGEAVVRAWDRDEVRVIARHAPSVRVNVRTVPTGVAVGATARSGPGRSVDYEISVPSWMPVRVNGHYTFVRIEGTQSDVSVENVRGDIVIVNTGGAVTARSIQGEVIVEGTRGKVSVSTVNDRIRITGASGDITAETTNGSIALSRIESVGIEAGTINGGISYEGRPAANGRYRFTSHNGTLTVTVPENANATFMVRTFQGGFRSTLPLKEPPPAERNQGRRIAYTLGSGSAEFELETFAGGIRLRPPADTAAPAGKDKRKDKRP